jgi:hypothetical protein
MGETTGELRQAVDNKRDDAAQKIDQIEQKVGETTQQVKESLDWRRQVDEKPLMAVGAAFIGGMLLGGVTGGDDGNQKSSSEHWQSRKNPSGLGGAIRNAAKKSGFEDSLNDMATGLFGSLSSRMKEITGDKFPSLADKAQSGQSSTNQTAQMS